MALYFQNLKFEKYTIILKIRIHVFSVTFSGDEHKQPEGAEAPGDLPS